MKDMKIARTETVDKIVRNYNSDGVLVSQYPEFLAERDLPPILQLQADPFPTESDALAEQGFIEQDVTAPLTERTEWLQSENEKLAAAVASLVRLLSEERQKNGELARKAKLYDGYFAMLAQCLHDVKV